MHQPVQAQDKIGLPPLDTELVLTLWSQTYNTSGKPDWSHIFPYYHDNIMFQDPIQKVEGKVAFIEMCQRLTDRCESLNMKISSIAANADEILFDWEMTMIFRKTPNTSLFGATKLTLGEDGRIIRQRDYYDLWGDIFHNVPLMKKGYPRFMKRVFG